ncbi:MAG TPA: hypothetical protein VJ865_02725 [Gemmatimonadaceae bacterium]|nr:hypothetical protein [Gemmatimonadaceae bacterium]
MDTARIVGLLRTIKRLKRDLLKAKADASAAAAVVSLAELGLHQIDNHPDLSRALAAVDSYKSTRAAAKASNTWKAMDARLMELEAKASPFLELLESRRQRAREVVEAGHAREVAFRNCASVERQLVDTRQELKRLATSLSLPDLGLPRSGSFDECATAKFHEELSALRKYAAEFAPKVTALIPQLMAGREANAVALGERLYSVLNELRRRIQEMEGVRGFEQELICRDRFRAKGEYFVGPFRTELTATWAANELAKEGGWTWKVETGVKMVGSWSIQIWNVVEVARPEDRRFKAQVLNLGGYRAENSQRSRK